MNFLILTHLLNLSLFRPDQIPKFEACFSEDCYNLNRDKREILKAVRDMKEKISQFLNHFSLSRPHQNVPVHFV